MGADASITISDWFGGCSGELNLFGVSLPGLKILENVVVPNKVLC